MRKTFETIYILIYCLMGILIALFIYTCISGLLMSEEKYITMDGKESFITYNDYWGKMREKDIEIERLNNIIKELDKQNGELGAELSITKDRIDKTNWWLEQMLKQATNNETRAIISGTLELLLGSDKE